MQIALALLIVTQVQPSARQLVTASAEAIGGLDRLRAVTAVRVSEQGQEYLVSVGDPRLPHAMLVESITSLRRESPAALRRTIQVQSVMRSGAFSETIVASDSVVSTGSTFDRETSDEELALSPERVLLTALDAPDLRALPDSSIAGIRHHIVAFHWMDAAVRLALNASDGFPSYLSLVRAYPNFRFWAMWGDLRLVTHWSDWSLESTGLWYPRARGVTLNGEPFRAYIVTSIDLAAQAPPDSFAVADSVRANTSRALPEPALNPVTLADGIVLFRAITRRHSSARARAWSYWRRRSRTRKRARCWRRRLASSPAYR